MIVSSIANPTAGSRLPVKVSPLTRPFGMLFWMFVTVWLLSARPARNVGMARGSSHGTRPSQCIRVSPR
jgi:hypothetical protein